MRISIVIPTVPVRRRLLDRALASVWAQTRQVEAVHVSVDLERQGAAQTRDRGLAAVQTEWVAFLDDDDELLPNHIEALATHALDSGADLIYPWFDIGSGGTDPFPHHFGQPFDPAHPCQIPVTFLARTDAVRSAGGFSHEWDPELAEHPGTDPEGNRAGEDWRLTLRLIANGAKIVHLPHRTWTWHHWGGNSSGLPSRVVPA